MTASLWCLARIVEKVSRLRNCFVNWALDALTATSRGRGIEMWCALNALGKVCGIFSHMYEFAVDNRFHERFRSLGISIPIAIDDLIRNCFSFEFNYRPNRLLWRLLIDRSRTTIKDNQYIMHTVRVTSKIYYVTEFSVRVKNKKKLVIYFRYIISDILDI